MRNKSAQITRGFTLIELLVVIAIIGVLAAVVFIAINPAEILRKGRDTTRLNDVVVIRKAIDLAIADGGNLTATAFTGNSTGTRTTDVATNYVGIIISKYLAVLPIDPQQNATTAPTNLCLTVPAAGTWRYSFASDGEGYEINTLLESADNCSKAENDGGDNPDVYEIGTDPVLDLIT